MDHYQSLFDKIWSDQKILTLYIAKRLKKQNFEVSKEDLDKISDQLRNFEGDIFEVAFNNQQTLIDLGEQSDIDDFMADFNEKLATSTYELARKISEVVFKNLQNNAPAMLEEHRKEFKDFQKDLLKVWGKSLDLLDTLAVIALEAGDEFNKEFRPQAAQQNDFVFEALTRLHARACQVATEIRVLLRSGLADGALGRWRTLYEIVIISYFIKEHGQDTAERYLLHESIQNYSSANSYQSHHQMLGSRPITKKQLAIIELQRDKLIKNFEQKYCKGQTRKEVKKRRKRFESKYGWAEPDLVADVNPSFGVIETSVDMKHTYPFYDFASNNIHTNSKGLHFSLGLQPREYNKFLAGYSSVGLADVVDLTAIGLSQITTNLLMTRPNLDRIVTCEVLSRYIDEIREDLIRAQTKIARQRRNRVPKWKYDRNKRQVGSV